MGTEQVRILGDGGWHPDQSVKSVEKKRADAAGSATPPYKTGGAATRAGPT